MLPPFIIEQIRQREEEKRRDQRPVLELPIDDFSPRGGRRYERPSRDGRSDRERSDRGRHEGSWDSYDPDQDRGPDGNRGVTIIQF